MKTIQKKLLFILFILPLSIFAQSSLKGTVLDNLGQTLPGVNVIVKGSQNGVATDFDGNFTINNLKKGDVLVFSYLGFMTQDLVYNNQKEVSITMIEDSQQLADVVVIGYGTVKKSDATGSVSTVTTKDFVKGPVVSVDQMIQGKVAGLQITNGGGSPGEGSTIRIRGGSSLLANDPLIVIDGLPVDGGSSGGRNFLATINQNNIESVTVLKDASATAIYGSRASNGVIIITTKKGKAGELKVEYNGNLSYSKLVKKVDVLSVDQFRDYVNANASVAQQGLLGNSNTDWQDEIYQVATGTDHNVALSGGVDNITYRASAGFTDMNGILKRDNFQRTSIGLSLVGKFFDNHLKVEVNNNTASMKNVFANRGAIGSAVSYDPTQNPYNADGTYFQWYNSNGEVNTLAGRNPLGELYQNNNFGTQFRSVGNIQTEYKLHFFPDLKLVANLGYDEISGRTYGNTSVDYAYASAGNYYDNSDTFNNKLMDLFFNYNKDIKSFDAVVDFTAGYSYQDFKFKNAGVNFIAANNILNENATSRGRRNLQSFFGRTNLTFANKYLVTLSYRRDGSSRFTPENRWGNFPAAALAWKLNEESFVKNIRSISTLKLRLGWGITGQQDVGENYPSIPTYLTSDVNSQYQFGNQFYPTVRPQQYNRNLKWEETETRNIGLDFGFLKERITGSVDVYQKTSKDLLAFVPNPAFFGFSNADFYNIGRIKNKGIEISAAVIPVKNENFNWTIGGNITLQNSKVDDLFLDPKFFSGLATGGISGGVGNTVQNHQVGYAPNSFYVYEQAYNVNGQPIDGVYIDRNKDGIINEEDLYRYKKPASDVFYGLFTNLSYKNWDMSMSWRGSWGNYNYNNVDSQSGFKTQVVLNPSALNLNNSVTNLLDTNFTQARYLSDYYIQDASFVRLDNLTIGYNFTNFLNTKANAKLSLGGQNLLLFTNYKGIDPEISGGIDNNLYPRPRMYTLGLNVNF